jgi:hypothetical protein
MQIGIKCIFEKLKEKGMVFWMRKDLVKKGLS